MSEEHLIDASKYGFRFANGFWSKIGDDVRYTIYEGIMSDNNDTYLVCTYSKNVDTTQEEIIIRDIPSVVENVLIHEHRNNVLNSILTL
jgi:hypothetical protein